MPVTNKPACPEQQRHHQHSRPCVGWRSKTPQRSPFARPEVNRVLTTGDCTPGTATLRFSVLSVTCLLPSDDPEPRMPLAPPVSLEPSSDHTHLPFLRSFQQHWLAGMFGRPQAFATRASAPGLGRATFQEGAGKSPS